MLPCKSPREHGKLLDLMTTLRESSNGNDAIWVVKVRLSKCAHFGPLSPAADAYDIAMLLKDEVLKDKVLRGTSAGHA